MDGRPPRILVTGVAGYIGSHVALAGLDSGWEVVGLDDFSAGSPEAVPEGVRLHVMDCAADEVATLLEAERPDAAIHLAGRVDVAESMEDPLAYYAANLGAAVRFFRHASRARVPVVFASTAAVYDGSGPEPAAEDAPLGPSSPYGRSKLAAEWALRDAGEAAGLAHVILRFFNVAGADPALRAGPRPGSSHLVTKVCEAALRPGGTITINGTDYDTPDGTCLRDFVHVSDLAEALLTSVRHLVARGESLTLNCGYGRGYSVREVIDGARAIAPAAFAVSEGPRRPGDKVAVIARADALRHRFGWTPRHDDLGAILGTAMAWEEARSGAPEAVRPGRAGAAAG